MITDVSELKRNFKIESDKDDDIFYSLILSAQKIAEKYCDTKLEATDITEYQDGDGTDCVMTRNFPLNSVASVHDDVDREYGSDSLIASDEYTVDLAGIIRFDSRSMIPGNKNVKIVYNAGYSEEDMPYDLKVAIWDIAFANYLEAAAGVNAIVGEDFVYRPAKLRTDGFGILDRFKKMR